MFSVAESFPRTDWKEHPRAPPHDCDALNVFESSPSIYGIILGDNDTDKLYACLHQDP
jgi:hypothetical protein